MSEVISRGHLYIAQPPLYRLSRGNEKVYLKDEGPFQEYLLQRGLEKKHLILGDGQQLSGSQLKGYLEKVIAYQNALTRFENRGLPAGLLKVLIDEGLSEKELLRDREKLQEYGEKLAAAGYEFQLTEDEEHQAWRLEVWPTGKREQQPWRLEWELLSGSDFQALVKWRQELAPLRRPPYRLQEGDKGWEVATLEELLQLVLTEGQKGLTIQRFKGLGEMNPEQLWETTMDPETRTLLQVKIEDAVAADEIFTILMGDKVEPRRDFIQNNALDLAQLDI